MGSMGRERNGKEVGVGENLSMEVLLGEARGFLENAVPENTLRAHESDWRDFVKWCGRRNLSPLPARPQTIGLYLTARARVHKTSTLRRRLVTIRKVHTARGHADPMNELTLRTLWRGIVRTKGERVKKKAATLTEDIREMVRAQPPTLAGLRNRALILFGFAGSMRRSEIVALDVEDLELVEEGFLVLLRRSKTDQTGQGEFIAIPYGEHVETCPVRTMKEWLSTTRIVEGSIFRKVNRHGRLEGERLGASTVAFLIKDAVARIGKDPASFAGHSLRRGLITSASQAGVSEHVIQKQSRHKSIKVLREYIDHANLFRENAAKLVGL